jgi:hypothetical protein
MIVVDTWLVYNAFKNGMLCAQQQRKSLQKEFKQLYPCGGTY